MRSRSGHATHAGVDYQVQVNDPVSAALEGTVIGVEMNAKPTSFYGNLLDQA